MKSTATGAWRLLNALLLLACLVFSAGILITAWGWYVWDLMSLTQGLMMIVLGLVFGTVLGFIRSAFNVLPPKA